ncbi:MAG TPA: hypothetical protein VLF94_04680, partial [Chlamydiales bacterium]|nr:hypothetical protein [Chlamydiales bacterium]
GVDGVVQVAKQVGVWPRVDLDKEKPYLPELKVHVKLLIKQLETEISRQQSAHEMGQFVLDMLQDPNTPHPNGENHLKNTTGRMASIEACMAAATRDIQLLKEWQNGLAKILSASGRLQSPQ